MLKWDCDFRVVWGFWRRWRILNFGNIFGNGIKIFSGMWIVLRIMYFEVLYIFFIIRVYCFVVLFKLVFFVFWCMYIWNFFDFFFLFKNLLVKKGRGRFLKLYWNILFRMFVVIFRKFVYDLKKRLKVFNSYMYFYILLLLWRFVVCCNDYRLWV